MSETKTTYGLGGLRVETHNPIDYNYNQQQEKRYSIQPLVPVSPAPPNQVEVVEEDTALTEASDKELSKRGVRKSRTRKQTTTTTDSETNDN
jgi:hypothetical protein